VNKNNEFYKILKRKTHNFVLLVYTATERFPKSELYGTTSQVRRAAISVMLNFLEGFARFKPKVKLQFFETSYGSIKECRYLIFFALEIGWIERKTYDEMFALSDEIGAMVWSIIDGLDKQVNI